MSRSFAHRLTLRFDYEEPQARRLQEAISVEAGEIDDARSTASVDRHRGTVEVTLRARDTTALRASMNTWLRLVAVSEDIMSMDAGDSGDP